MPAGMMPEPPGCGVYLSARGRRTRSAFGEYPPKRRPLMSEIRGGYRQRSGEVKRRRVFFDESGRSHCAFFLERRGTPMIRSGEGESSRRAVPIAHSPRRGKSAKRGCVPCGTPPFGTHAAALATGFYRDGSAAEPGFPRRRLTGVSPASLKNAAVKHAHSAVTACRPERRPQRAGW